MTQRDVADSLGIGSVCVSRWECDRSQPSTDNLFALAKILGKSVEHLRESRSTAKRKT